MKSVVQIFRLGLPLFLLSASIASASPPPDPLATASGEIVTTAAAFRQRVRPETLRLFRETIYGVRPVEKPADFSAKIMHTDTGALGGKATSKEIEFRYSGPRGKGGFHALLLTPNAVKSPAPVFVVLHFTKPDPTSEDSVNGAWPAEKLIDRGYATAAFDVNEVDPDSADGYSAGVRAMFDAQPPPADAWGALSAWGWGASRVLDYLETDPAIDAKRVAVLGHSRRGKAALWCGAEDERFAMVVSNDSGCAGAALARTKKGERIANIVKRFPYWFSSNFAKYAGREDELPIDQHQLLGLIAPRPLYVASATRDQYADPGSEFASCVLAGPIYRLFGKTGLGSPTPPAPGGALESGSIGYFLRAGTHDMLPVNWDHYLDFADESLTVSRPSSN